MRSDASVSKPCQRSNAQTRNGRNESDHIEPQPPRCANLCTQTLNHSKVHHHECTSRCIDQNASSPINDGVYPSPSLAPSRVPSPSPDRGPGLVRPSSQNLRLGRDCPVRCCRGVVLRGIQRGCRYGFVWRERRKEECQFVVFERLYSKVRLETEGTLTRMGNGHSGTRRPCSNNSCPPLPTIP